MPTRARRLDNRTIGICVCIALLAALAAALAVSFFGGDTSTTGTDDSTPKLDLTPVDPDAPQTPPGDPIPGLVGDSFKLTQFVGTPVVVNFFSSTCVPCIKEMPDLEALHQELGGQVEFIGIDVTDTEAKGKALVKSTGVTYRTGYDPDGNVLRDLNGQGLPTTVIIDADGKVVDARTGALTKDELRRILADAGLLGGAAPAPAATTTAPP